MQVNISVLREARQNSFESACKIVLWVGGTSVLNLRAITHTNKRMDRSQPFVNNFKQSVLSVNNQVGMSSDNIPMKCL